MVIVLPMLDAQLLNPALLWMIETRVLQPTWCKNQSPLWSTAVHFLTDADLSSMTKIFERILSFLQVYNHAEKQVILNPTIFLNLCTIGEIVQPSPFWSSWQENLVSEYWHGYYQYNIWNHPVVHRAPMFDNLYLREESSVVIALLFLLLLKVAYVLKMIALLVIIIKKYSWVCCLYYSFMSLHG